MMLLMKGKVGGRPAATVTLVVSGFISSIIYIPFLGVKVQSEAHYSCKKITFL